MAPVTRPSIRSGSTAHASCGWSARSSDSNGYASRNTSRVGKNRGQPVAQRVGERLGALGDRERLPTLRRLEVDSPLVHHREPVAVDRDEGLPRRLRPSRGRDATRASATPSLSVAPTSADARSLRFCRREIAAVNAESTACICDDEVDGAVPSPIASSRTRSSMKSVSSSGWLSTSHGVPSACGIGTLLTCQYRSTGGSPSAAATS